MMKVEMMCAHSNGVFIGSKSVLVIVALDLSICLPA